MTADTVTTQLVSAASAASHPSASPETTEANGPEKTSASQDFFSFGPYRLFPRQRLLLRNDKPLPIGNRALDILILLAERQGEVVGKNELIARVWPGITIDEGGLRVHVAGLRRALGDEIGEASYIKTVAGRGYCLVATASRAEPAREIARHAETKVMHPARLPLPLAGMVGRTDDVRKISSLLDTSRVVTIHGPGGVGKTTTAVAVGHAQLASFEGAVHFLDLGNTHEPRLLPAALASTFGLSAQIGDPTVAVLEFLRNRRMLLIFDSCEHLIEPVTALIERVLCEAPQVSILATSRETLRAGDEHVYRLSGLERPTVDDEQSAERIFARPAASLLVRRVVASGHQFELTEANAQLVAKICRKLDGLPLAINLAAARVPAFGLCRIASALEMNAWLFWQGQRTALPRHQTMAAALDWSYGRLDEDEKTVLHYLSSFEDSFTLEAACEAARQVLRAPCDDLLVLDKLITKSLISLEAGEDPARYRLLNSTRTYALEKIRIKSGSAEPEPRLREYKDPELQAGCSA
jgi:predicted ATPase/DNA-binding winged helix-turn-helix (wHTH) protein